MRFKEDGLIWESIHESMSREKRLLVLLYRSSFSLKLFSLLSQSFLIMVFQFMGHVGVHDQSLLFNEISMCVREILLVVREFSFSGKLLDHLLLLQIVIIPSFKLFHGLHLETISFFLLSFHPFNYCLNLFILHLQNLFFLLSFLLSLLWHLSLMKGQSTPIFLLKLHLLSKSIAHLTFDKSREMRIGDCSLWLFYSVVEIRFLLSSINRLIE